MALTLTTAPTGELLSVEEAKRHLRILSSDFDTEVAALIRASRDYCERYTQRTLREATARTLKQATWWTCHLDLPWPPLLSSPALTITYYDTSNAQQTLGSSNYQVEYSTDGGGRIRWSTTATIPSLYTRADAVQIAFSTGYADADALPPIALQAMKVMLTVLWGASTEGEITAAQKCVERLLGTVDWTGYA